MSGIRIERNHAVVAHSVSKYRWSMRLKLLFIVGLGAGYILGARAGRPRYERIRAKATEAWEDPRVQKVVADTQDFVKDNAPIVREKIVAGAKATVAGTQDAAARATEIAQDISGKIAESTKDVAKSAREASKSVAKTAKEVRDRLVDHGEEIVDGVIIAAGTAREDALDAHVDDDKQ